MKNIYLVGFMATGKSSVAKEVARRLEANFLDLDTLIQEKEKMTIVDIFAKKGESYFRQQEQRLIQDVSQKTNTVVSCGGGAMADPTNVKLLKQSGIVICLGADVDTILRRAAHTKERPLLNTENPRQKIIDLLGQRKKFYDQAHYQIDTSPLSVAGVADAVLTLMNKETKP